VISYRWNNSCAVAVRPAFPKARCSSISSRGFDVFVESVYVSFGDLINLS
jgi:hypothetical protein